MPKGMYKSRTLRRVFTRTPSGKSVIRYKQRKPSAAHCGRCGAQLQGMPRVIPSKVAKLFKTQKRPERPFGGVLCSRCLRDTMKLEAREE